MRSSRAEGTAELILNHDRVPRGDPAAIQRVGGRAMAKASLPHEIVSRIPLLDRVNPLVPRESAVPSVACRTYLVSDAIALLASLTQLGYFCVGG